MDNTLLKAQQHELAKTTNTRGWSVVAEISNQIIREAELKVMECNDDSQIIALQRKAQAARQFVAEFYSRIQKMVNIDLAEPGNEFNTVATE